MDKLLGTGKVIPEELNSQIKWEFFEVDEYFPRTASLPTGRPRRRGGWRGILRRLISIRPATLMIKKVLRGEVGLGFSFDVSSNTIKSLVRGLCWWNDWFIGNGFWYILVLQTAILYGLYLYLILFENGDMLYWVLIDEEFPWMER